MDGKLFRLALAFLLSGAASFIPGQTSLTAEAAPSKPFVQSDEWLMRFLKVPHSSLRAASSSPSHNN